MKKENTKIIAENEQQESTSSLVLQFNKRTLKYVLIVITFTICLYWIINHFDNFMSGVGSIIGLISPFLIGFCVSFVINTLMNPLEKLWDKVFTKAKGKWKEKIRRPICLILSLIIVLSVIFAIIFMVIPQLKNTILEFVDMLPQYIENLTKWWADVISFLGKYGITLPSLNLDFDKIVDSIKGLVVNHGTNFINKTFHITGSIAGAVVNTVIGFVFSIYLLSQKESFGAQTKKALYAIVPETKADKIINLASLTNQTFTKFVTGQLTEAVIIGLLCFIGMLILRMPYASVISVLVGFTALIPVFGAFVGTAIGAFLILMVDPMKAIWFVVFIIVLQQLEGNLIYPKVVGKSVGLPGIWVLTAVTIGGGAFGVLGMLFSVPVCSVVYTVFKEYVVKRLKEKRISPQKVN